MVAGVWVREVSSVLAGAGVVVASSIDFPMCGITTTVGKAAGNLVRSGVLEIDMGTQIGWLGSGIYREFRDDIAAVVKVGVPVKVMLELPLLSQDDRDAAVDLAIEAGAAVLKNAGSGHVEIANVDRVRYLVARAKGRVRVKASGGIKSYQQAADLLAAGAGVIGTSSGVAIVHGPLASTRTRVCFRNGPGSGRHVEAL